MAWFSPAHWTRPVIATPGGIAAAAGLLDELLARRAVPGRPAGLGDDAAWVRARYPGGTSIPIRGSR